MAIMRAQPAIVVQAQGASAPSTAVVPAASNIDGKARVGFAVGGVLLVIAGAIGGWFLFKSWDPIPFQPASDYSVFAGLFVVAAAVERLLEPFSSYVKPDTVQTKKELDNAIVTAKTSPAEDKSEEAANKQTQLDRERSERAFLLWGVATSVATLLCAGFGLLMLRAVTEEAAKDPNRFLDLIVTGLVVGAGTKPLHDLITRVQKTKEKATDPAETNS